MICNDILSVVRSYGVEILIFFYSLWLRMFSLARNKKQMVIPATVEKLIKNNRDLRAIPVSETVMAWVLMEL